MDSVDICSLIGIISILVQMCCYAEICRRCRSWVNFATFPLLSNLVLNGVFEVLSLSTFGVGGSLYAYSYCQACYAATAAAYVVGLMLPPPKLKPFRSLQITGRLPAIVPWLFLIVGILIYLPILIKYRAYLLTPRLIYADTSSGFGFQFFISAMFITVAWACFLFIRKGWISTAFFLVTCLVMLYLHGSKGQLISLLVIGVLYRVYALDQRVSIARFFPMLLISGILFSTIFYYLSYINTPAALLADMEGYADYSRNAMTVIDHPAISRGPYYGQLMLEDELYPRVPRFLDRDKPKEFGAGRLERLFFPERFDEQTGSPAFGIGMPYADFGPFTIVWVFGSSVWLSWVTVGFIGLLRRNPKNPGLFLVVLFLSGIAILSLGMGFLLPEMILLGYCVNFAFKLAKALGLTSELWRPRRYARQRPVFQGR